MKKVVYVLTSPAHKRVLESFVERNDLEQLVIGPEPKKSRYVPEDYSDFKLKNITTYTQQSQIAKIVKDFKPDIYVQPDLTPIHNSTASGIKRVYISHGMVGNHVIDLTKVEKFNLSVWQGMDLYCGADEVFRKWVNYVVGGKEVLTNAFPQLDILYNSAYYDSYRDKILQQTKLPKADKVILFIGFAGKDRADFKYHNEDYFKATVELARLAEKYNWLIMIKPRSDHKKNIGMLQQFSWGSQYINKYMALRNNKHVHFIEAADAHIYRYYFADAFVMNGCSTAEIEACAIQKPLFIVRTHLPTLQKGYDPYNTVSSGAAIPIPDIIELEHDLLGYFNNKKYHRPDKQKKLLEDMHISFDGKHHERIQNKLKEL